MSNVADMHGIKDSGSIKLKASPFSNIGKQDVLNPVVDVPATAYKICNSSHISSTQFSSIGNSILKPGIPKLSAHEVSDDVSICPVILHPTKQLSSQVISNDLIKTIGFPSGRSQITTQHQSRIVASSFQRSMMESQNVSPLIITPKPHNVTHTSINDVVSSKAKIVPIPSTPLSSHFSVINKSSVPEYTAVRHSSVPTYYPQSDFARFPNKSNHKVGLLNPAVLHGPITSGYNEDTGLTIPNSQHVFKPIISPRPSILRKRDADGVLRAQKNLIPILTKTDLEGNQNSENRNGYSESGLQIDSIMVPQIPEVVLPRISALTNQSHIMVEISPRKKPRKQLLPVNQESSFKIVGDEMLYIEEKFPKNDKIKEDLPDEDTVDCNENCKDDDQEVDDFDDLDDNCPMDDEFDDEIDDDHFADGFDYKLVKPFSEEAKGPTDHSDDSSSLKSKNKRPTLLGSLKNTGRGQTHHFQKYTDFKIKETKKQLAELQQTKKWMSNSRSAWRVHYLLKQFIEMGKNEEDIVEQMNELLKFFEKNIYDLKIRHTLIELAKDNIQRSKVTKGGIEEIIYQLNKIFEYKPLIEDVVDKYCPKELKKKNIKVLNKSIN